jgi:hypothetical protein
MIIVISNRASSFVDNHSKDTQNIDSTKEEYGNINLQHYSSPCPVDKFSFNKFSDISGNVWQWTETSIYPFEGFEPHPMYDDFTMPTFDGLHNLIKGGSFISTGNLSNPDSRYAFRKHFFQHAGFRYVESSNNASYEKNTSNNNLYNLDEVVMQYIDMHYGQEYFEVPNYPKYCIDNIITITGGEKADYSTTEIAGDMKFSGNLTLDSTLVESGAIVDQIPYLFLFVIQMSLLHQ